MNPAPSSHMLERQLLLLGDHIKQLSSIATATFSPTVCTDQAGFPPFWASRSTQEMPEFGVIDLHDQFNIDVTV